RVSERQHLVLVLCGDGVARFVGAKRLTRLGAGIDRLLRERVDRFEIALLGFAHARFAEIVKRHLEGNVKAAAVSRWLAFVLLRLGDADGVEHIDEARLARESEGTGER